MGGAGAISPTAVCRDLVDNEKGVDDRYCGCWKKSQTKAKTGLIVCGASSNTDESRIQAIVGPSRFAATADHRSQDGKIRGCTSSMLFALIELGLICAIDYFALWYIIDYHNKLS